MHNTKINIEYRDADNYKSGVDLILAGEFTREQWASLSSVFHEGEFFVPAQIGLPNPALLFQDQPDFPNEEADHGSCVLTDFDVPYDDYYQHNRTKESPTHFMSCNEFYEACKNAQWDPVAEYARMESVALRGDCA